METYQMEEKEISRHAERIKLLGRWSHVTEELRILPGGIRRKEADVISKNIYSALKEEAVSFTQDMLIAAHLSQTEDSKDQARGWLLVFHVVDHLAMGIDLSIETHPEVN